jgi:hypothetical protein
MARAGRPKGTVAKAPAVNDNRPLSARDNRPQPTPQATQQPGDHGDDCRNELMAMPDVGALDFTAQFSVWAIRSWVQAFKSKESFEDVTHQAFARFGLTRAALAIDSLMTVLAASASRSIDIRCVQCRLLSPDEALLIDAMAAAQSGGFFVATVALRQLMPGTAARAALPHLVDLARDLGEAGMMAQPIPPHAGAPAVTAAEMPASTSRVLH